MKVHSFRRNKLLPGLLLAGALLPASDVVVAADVMRVVDGRPQSVSVGAATPSALMLARDWHAGLDPVNFLISEKLDGVRAYWDGRQLRFRSGRLIAAPAWFLAALPAVALDGELWMGRHTFDALSAAVRKDQPVDAEWRSVRYMVFDLPGASGAFGQRAADIRSVVQSAGVAWLQAVVQLPGTDSAALQKQLAGVIRDGGEGLVLHRMDAPWKAGRSDALRKLKLQPDEDARVVGWIAGKGKHEGRLGALMLELPNGQRFALGTGFTDARREKPPAVGSLVTYRYRDRTASGLPKFASFLRERLVE